MEKEDLGRFITQLAVIAERLDQRSSVAVERVELSARGMEGSARQLSGQGEEFIREVAQALQQRAGEIVGQGLGGAMERINRELDEASRKAGQAAQALEQERQRLQRERKTWLWLGAGALLTGSVLAIGASTYAVMHGRQQVKQYQLEAALLRAYNQADVTLCDGERLCANVEDKGERYGPREQYRVVEPR